VIRVLLNQHDSLIILGQVEAFRVRDEVHSIEGSVRVDPGIDLNHATLHCLGRTKSVSVEKGVAAGDTISALLFILVQEILTRATRRSGEVVRCPRVQEVVPSIRGFMY